MNGHFDRLNSMLPNSTVSLSDYRLLHIRCVVLELLKEWVSFIVIHMMKRYVMKIHVTGEEYKF